jgi:hypothetical protein
MSLEPLGLTLILDKTIAVQQIERKPLVLQGFGNHWLQPLDSRSQFELRRCCSYTYPQ